MEIPPKILKIMELAGKEGSRPFDRLESAKPLAKGRETVASLTEKDLGLKNPQTLLLAQSALYIYFDCFEEAHNIAQDHEGVIGNWLHAIAHRREPDPGNSKYWYARTRIPAKVSQGIAGAALGQLGKEPPKELEALQRKMSQSGEWEPESFVDLCAPIQGKDPASPAYQTLARIQETEWRGLIVHLLSH